MKNNSNIFLNKKILIYGLGKSGISTFKFLKGKNKVFLYDDKHIKYKNYHLKKNLISHKKILQLEIDLIILSPGIDINKCKLTKFLKKNYRKIYTDFDVFFEFYKNDCITITGTNGKSTTCQLLYEVLTRQRIDARLVGNIGNPILSIRNVKKKTIFVIEASSYQLEYSKIFRSKYSVILNLSPDHIERHKTMKNYIKAKFRLLKNQIKGNIAFINYKDPLIIKKIKKDKYKSRIIKVGEKKVNKFLKEIRNSYFASDTNKENLSFVLEISEILGLKKDLFKKSIINFTGLKYRQQIIYQKSDLMIINDSKSTSFSSSISLLKTKKNIYWLLGGLPKKGDKFELSRSYFKNIKAFIFGKNKKFFNKKLQNKIHYENFGNLRLAYKKVFEIIKKNGKNKKIILFSPCAASFDNFKNFEDRGLYFNKLTKKYLNEY